MDNGVCAIASSVVFQTETRITTYTFEMGYLSCGLIIILDLKQNSIEKKTKQATKKGSSKSFCNMHTIDVAGV